MKEKSIGMKYGNMEIELHGVTATITIGDASQDITTERLDTFVTRLKKAVDLESRRRAFEHKIADINSELEHLRDISDPRRHMHLVYMSFAGGTWKPNLRQGTRTIRVEWTKGLCTVENMWPDESLGFPDCTETWSPSVWESRETELFQDLPPGLRAAVFKLISAEQE